VGERCQATAHLAPDDQDTWDKYQLAKLAAGNVTRNTFIIAPLASARDPADFQSPEGAFSAKGNRWSCRGEVSYSWPATVPRGISPSVFPPPIKSRHLPVDKVAAVLSNSSLLMWCWHLAPSPRS
jgi:hypothetical protein